MSSRLSEQQSRLVTDNYNEVKKIAKTFARRIPNTGDILDDLIGAGTEGLIDAALKFDPLKNESFIAYAQIRIRGAIQDALRQLDTKSRDDRIKTKKIDKAEAELRYSDGGVKDIDQDTLATLVGIDIDTLNQLRHEVRIADIAGLSAADPGEAVDSKIEGQQGIAWLLRLINKTLNDIERDTIYSHVMGDATLLELGKQWGVTESRMCQIEGEAMRKLREAIEKIRKRKKGPPTSYGKEKIIDEMRQRMRCKDLHLLARSRGLGCKVSMLNKLDIKARLLAAIANAMQQALNECERKVLHLCLFRDFPEKKAGRQLGISEIQCKVLKRVAVERLSHFLITGSIATRSVAPRSTRGEKPLTLSDITRRRIREVLHQIRTTADEETSSVVEDQAVTRLLGVLKLTSRPTTEALERVLAPVMDEMLKPDERQILADTILHQQPLERISVITGRPIGELRLIRARALMCLESALQDAAA